jgi:hypothetical protein
MHSTAVSKFGLAGTPLKRYHILQQRQMFILSSNELPPRAAFLSRNLDVKDFAGSATFLKSRSSGPRWPTQQRARSIRPVNTTFRSNWSLQTPDVPGLLLLLFLLTAREGCPSTDSIVLPVRTGPVSPCA